ncbi:MAG: polysaccharide biosynthesis/export family protein [Alphaproteobacteria bacterium]|nr:polysaccharide biosynthesis/export family protein [Alphaproteobacteria bacterium]
MSNASRRDRSADDQALVWKTAATRGAGVSRSGWFTRAAHAVAAHVFSALALGGILAGPLSLAAGAADDSVYRLRVSDKLAIKVGQWKPVEEKYEDWSGLSGTYTIGADGKISVAMAGSIQAAGETTEAVAERIAVLLQTKIGLTNKPAASVEIAEYNPVYVVGGVTTPGEFKYRPNLTVIQAVGLAGGLLRARTLQLRADRDRLTAVRDYNVLKLERWALLAKKARLMAELNEREKIEAPMTLIAAPSAEHLIKAEQAILDSRRRAFKSKIAAIEDLRKILKQKLQKLDEEIKIRTRQLKSTKQQLEDASELLKRGLTTKPRESGLEVVVTDFESKLIALEVLNLTTEQQLNATVRDELDLINTLRQEIVDGLKTTQQELDVTNTKLVAAEALLNEAATFASMMADTKGDSKTKFSYTVQRRIEGVVQTVNAEEVTALQPGDTLQVIITSSDPTMQTLLDMQTPG